jgi:hypothetical protein
VFILGSWTGCGVECGVVELNGGEVRGEIARDDDVIFVLSS